jgi:hypothetical protein
MGGQGESGAEGPSLTGRSLAGQPAYRRNQQMLDEGRPDLVVAFPGGAGTANMVKLARAIGCEVIEA